MSVLKGVVAIGVIAVATCIAFIIHNVLKIRHLSSKKGRILKKAPRTQIEWHEYGGMTCPVGRGSTEHSCCNVEVKMDLPACKKKCKETAGCDAVEWTGDGEGEDEDDEEWWSKTQVGICVLRHDVSMEDCFESENADTTLYSREKYKEEDGEEEEEEMTQIGEIGDKPFASLCDVAYDDRNKLTESGVEDDETACLAKGGCFEKTGKLGVPNCYYAHFSKGARWGARKGMMKTCLRRKKWADEYDVATSGEDMLREHMIENIQGEGGAEGGALSQMTNAELLAVAGCGVGGKETFPQAAKRPNSRKCTEWTKK